MVWRSRRDDGSRDLESTRTERTLRDVLHELPVDALVPDGWRVGTEVLQFEDRVPTDGVTLSHPEYPRDLVVTEAGTGSGEALAVHERDRVAGRRTVLATVPERGTDREETRAALEAAARAASRVEGAGAGDRAVDAEEPAATFTGDSAGRTLNFY